LSRVSCVSNIISSGRARERFGSGRGRDLRCIQGINAPGYVTPRTATQVKARRSLRQTRNVASTRALTAHPHATTRPSTRAIPEHATSRHRARALNATHIPVGRGRAAAGKGASAAHWACTERACTAGTGTSAGCVRARARACGQRVKVHPPRACEAGTGTSAGCARARARACSQRVKVHPLRIGRARRAGKVHPPAPQFQPRYTTCCSSCHVSTRGKSDASHTYQHA